MKHRSQFAYLVVVGVISAALCLSGALTPTAFAGTTDLTWTNPAPTGTQGVAAGNKVYRSTDTVLCDNLTALLPLYQTLPSAVSAYTDPSVPDVNGKVCYEVTAYNAGGESPRSNRVSRATTVNPPPAPTGLAIR